VGPLEVGFLIVVLAIVATPVLLLVRVTQARRARDEQRHRELVDAIRDR
jgi:hypothetical protein